MVVNAPAVCAVGRQLALVCCLCSDAFRDRAGFDVLWTFPVELSPSVIYTADVGHTMMRLHLADCQLFCCSKLKQERESLYLHSSAFIPPWTDTSMEAGNARLCVAEVRNML